MQDRTYNTNAPKGVALLDVKDPHWRDTANPYTLNMSDSENCLLAQRYGTFQLGMIALFPDYLTLPIKDQVALAYEYGFDVDGGGKVTDDQLNAHWTAILEGVA